MKILVRFGDLMLKGRNKKIFINKINRHIKLKFKDLDVELDKRHDRLYLNFDESLYEEVEKKILEIPGISSFSVVYTTEKNIEEIKNKALKVLEKELKENREYTFKVETKRSDKRFPYTSIGFTQEVAPLILKESNKDLKVDVRNPEIILNIDIRDDYAYLYVGSKPAMGGFPAGIAGRGLVMTSGGIDSPVAAYLTLKQGVEVELFHFESTPLTPLESINKVIDISKELAKYMPNEKIRLHFVPFFKIHEAILNNVSDPYMITIMRRIMYRIAEQYANKHKIPILINGESLGQVASQTLSSINVVENVTTIPIIRPVITYDKQEIINISRNIGTYDISIRPFNDCCSIYVPKNPVINPTIKESLFQERKYDFTPLVEEATNSVITLIIDENTNLDLAMYGFTLEEAIANWRQENDNLKE